MTISLYLVTILFDCDHEFIFSHVYVRYHYHHSTFSHNHLLDHGQIIRKINMVSTFSHGDLLYRDNKSTFSHDYLPNCDHNSTFSHGYLLDCDQIIRKTT